MSKIEINQLPLAIAVSGPNDFVAIDHSNGDGTYTTKKVPPNLLAAPPTFMTTGTFTLTPNQLLTVVPVTGCLPTSKMAAPCPLWEGTGHAANDMIGSSYEMGTDEFTVHHASNPRTDRKFMFVLFF
jgi:hypothetical protein